jgi:hypothetical protein
VTLTVGHKLLEYGPKCGPTPSGPPLMQISVWTKEMFVKYLTTGKFIDKFLGESVIDFKAVSLLRRSK